MRSLKRELDPALPYSPSLREKRGPYTALFDVPGCTYSPPGALEKRKDAYLMVKSCSKLEIEKIFLTSGEQLEMVMLAVSPPA